MKKSPHTSDLSDSANQPHRFDKTDHSDHSNHTPTTPRRADSSFSFRRLRALCRKETLQIIRDPTSILIAFVLPIIMLFIYGYGINLDTGRTRVGLLAQDSSPDARQFVASLTGSRYLDISTYDSYPAISEALTRSHIRGFVVIPADFSAKLRRAESNLAAGTPADAAPLQVIADGSEPNTANFVQGYVLGAWQNWLAYRAAARGQPMPAGITVETTYWYNPTAESRYYLIPGSITIIMTVIGAILTALVIAREWERGIMEALLSSPVTRTEILLSKIIPYYLLGMLVLLMCIAIAHYAMDVPFRGTPLPILISGSLFLLSVLGMGLLFSTITRNQFNAAQIALFAAFLPAMMFSGFLFEISSMPAAMRAFTTVVPARYFVVAMQTLSQVGDSWALLRKSMIFLACTVIFFLGLTAKFTRKRLD